MPEVTSINFSRLMTFGRYENEKLGVSVQLKEGDTPESTLQFAVEWVEGKLKERERLKETTDELGYQVQRLEQRKLEAEHAVEQAQERYNTVKAFMEKHEMKMPPWLDDVEEAVEKLTPDEEEEDREETW